MELNLHANVRVQVCACVCVCVIVLWIILVWIIGEMSWHCLKVMSLTDTLDRFGETKVVFLFLFFQNIPWVDDESFDHNARQPSHFNSSSHSHGRSHTSAVLQLLFPLTCHNGNKSLILTLMMSAFHLGMTYSLALSWLTDTIMEKSHQCCWVTLSLQVQQFFSRVYTRTKCRIYGKGKYFWYFHSWKWAAKTAPGNDVSTITIV